MKSLRSVRSVLAAVCTVVATVAAVSVCPPPVAFADDDTPFYMGSFFYAYGQKQTLNKTYSYPEQTIIPDTGGECTPVFQKTETWSMSVTPLFVAPSLARVSYPSGFASGVVVIGPSVAERGSNGKWTVSKGYTAHYCFSWQYMETYGTVTQVVPVTVQNHYYDLSAPSGEVQVDSTEVTGKQDDGTSVLKALNFSLKDWNAASAGNNADLSFTITQDGKDASAASEAFYKGVPGTYQVTAKAESTSDPTAPRGRVSTAGPVSVRVVDTRAEAKAEIEAKRAEVKAKLAAPNLPDVTDSQREALLKKADDEAEKALTNIDAATSTAEVTAAKTDGIAALEKIVPEGELTDKREAAKKQVVLSASDATSQVEGLSKLTEAERKAFSDRITQEAQSGKTAIDEAALDQVEAKKTEAQNKIAEIVAEAKKQVYKDEVNKRRDEVIAAINAKSDLDSAAKEALVKEATDKAAQACANIDAAGSSATAIEEAKTAGIKALDAVNLDAAKQNAVAKLDKDAAAAREQIAQLKNLTDKERAQAEVDIVTKLDDAKDRVNDAATVDAAVAAQVQGSEDLAAVVQTCKDFDAKNLKEAKEDAVAELRKRAEELTEQVDAEWTSLADPDGVKKGINATLKQYVDAINQKDEVDDLTAVADLLSKGLTELEQAGAKAEIEDYAAKAKAEVNAHADLTKSQKQEYATKVDAEAKKAITDNTGTVDKAANASEAAKARDEAKRNIDKITVDAAGAQGKAAVQAKADAAKSAIDALQNLSDPDENGKSAAEQKQEAKDAIDQAAAKAQTDITGYVTTYNNGDGATPSAAGTKSDIDGASQTAFSTIAGLLDSLTAKDKANLSKAIEQANKNLEAKAEQSKQRIDALPDLSEEDKTKAKAEIDSTVSSAKKKIAAKPSITQVNAVVTDEATPAVDDRVTQAELDDAKIAARKELEAKAAEIDKQIDAKQYLSEADKQKLHDEVASTLEEHLAKVDAATDTDGVSAAKQAGLDALDAIGAEADKADEEARQRQLAQAKEAAKNALDTKAEEAKKLIDQLQNVDQAAKDKAKAEIDQARDQAKAKVEAASSTSEVSSEQQAGYEAIDSIVDALAGEDEANLNAKKLSVNTALELDAQHAKEQIEALTNLSEAQKQAAKADIDKLVDEARRRIDAATTISEVAQTDTDTTDSTLSRVDQSELDDAKAAAIKELEAKAAEVDKLIDAKQYLSEAQKRELHERVAATLAEYVAKVNAAESTAKVNEAKQAGLEALEAIGADATCLDEEAAAARAKAAALSATGSAVTAPALLAVFALLLGAALALSRRPASR